MQVWFNNKPWPIFVSLYVGLPIRSLGCTNCYNNKAGKRTLCETTNVNMNRNGMQARTPTTDEERIKMRDAKMWLRESIRDGVQGNSRSRCPCSLCLFGRPLLRATQAKHLQDYGRHPLKRLQPQVLHISVQHSLFLLAVGFS